MRLHSAGQSEDYSELSRRFFRKTNRFQSENTSDMGSAGENNAKLKKAVGKRLRAARKALGFTAMKPFSEKLGVRDPKRYEKWESGDAMFPVEWAIHLQDQYKVSMDWLYGNDPSGIPPRLWERIEQELAA